MANSGTFDPDPGALAPQSDEFLAGVLALARISRVTVALESGANAGPALLAAARLTGHAETCLLFEKWRDEPLPALRSAIAEGDGDEAAADAGAGSLRDLLHAMQARRRHSFLLIFNRFERLLAMPAEDPAYRAFEQAFVELAEDRDLDLHMLLVLDEADEDLLARLEQRIPGIGDGCLRISQSGAAGPPRPATAVPNQDGAGASRDRSFGRLLERLTAIAPAEAPQPPRESSADQDQDQTWPAGSGAAQAHDPAQPIHSHTPGAQHETDGMRQQLTPAHAIVPETVQAEPPASVEEVPASPGEGSTAAARPDTPFAAARSHAQEMTLPAAPRRRTGAWAAALALLVAIGAGVFALRQPTPTRMADSAVPQTRAPAQAPAPAPEPAPEVLAQQQPATARDQTVSAAPTAAAPPPAASEPQPAPPASGAAATAATAGDAATAAAAAAPPASPPVAVYVHVRDARERDRVQSQARGLARQGIRLVDIKITNRGPSVADLRYFHDEDRAEALTVQKALLAAGVPVAKLSRMNGFESTTRRRHFEAWLDGGAGQR